jgi:predicted GNAT family acetyltransferase
MAVNLSIYQDAQGFLAAAGTTLYGRETVNNLILGVSERLYNDPRAYENPFFAAVSNADGEVLLAALMTPPHNLILAGEAGAEAGYALLAAHLQNHPIPGVIAPAEIAEGFGQAWGRQTGDAVEIGMRQRVYELRTVQMPTRPPGAFRLAIPADIPIIAKWFQAFEVEALRETHHLDLGHAQRLVTAGNAFVWEREGKLVSMAIKTRPIAHSITVSGVYTPLTQRCQGYASALVAHLSQRLLDEGYQFVNLFTDLDNPTSNKIYQAIGYQPVCDFCVVSFTSERD